MHIILRLCSDRSNKTVATFLIKPCDQNIPFFRISLAFRLFIQTKTFNLCVFLRCFSMQTSHSFVLSLRSFRIRLFRRQLTSCDWLTSIHVARELVKLVVEKEKKGCLLCKKQIKFLCSCRQRAIMLCDGLMVILC